MALPGLRFLLDGRLVRVREPSWEAILSGGWDSFQGEIPGEEALRVGQDSSLTVYTDRGRPVWQGRLLRDPVVLGGVGSIVAAGPRIRAERRGGRLLYQSRDTALFSPLEGPPYNTPLTGQQFFQTENVGPNGVPVWVLKKSEEFPSGSQLALAAWARGSPGGITRLAFTQRRDGSTLANTQIRVARFTGPAGAATTVVDYSLNDAAAESARDTGMIAGAEDAVRVGLRQTGDIAALNATRRIALKDLRINGIAPGDVFSSQQVVSDLAARLGWSVSLYGAPGLANVLPFDHLGGPWSDALDYVVALSDSWWRVREDDVVEFGDWSTSRVWEVRLHQGAEPQLTPEEIFNRVVVEYEDVAGAPRQVVVDASPDPLAGTTQALTAQPNVWTEQLADVQPDDSLPLAVANALLPKVSTRRWAGRLDVYEATQRRGRVGDAGGIGSAYEIMPGDLVRVVDWGPNQEAVLRVHSTAGTDEAVVLGIEAPASITGVVTAAGLVRSREPSQGRFVRPKETHSHTHGGDHHGRSHRKRHRHRHTHRGDVEWRE